MEDKVNIYKNKGYQIYQAVVSDTDNESVSFKITNNGQSSSILELETHLKHHSHIYVVKEIEQKTITMKTFIDANNFNMHNYNFINLDIQGAELKALKGMGEYLEHVDYIYTEVNQEYLYKNCALLHEIDEYLEKYGFRREILKMTEFKWGDAFYVKRT